MLLQDEYKLLFSKYKGKFISDPEVPTEYLEKLKSEPTITQREKSKIQLEIQWRQFVIDEKKNQKLAREEEMRNEGI